MKERKAPREYAGVLIEMMKDLDGFKINSFDSEPTIKIKYRRSAEKWKIKIT